MKLSFSSTYEGPLISKENLGSTRMSKGNIMQAKLALALNGNWKLNIYCGFRVLKQKTSVPMKFFRPLVVGSFDFVFGLVNFKFASQFALKIHTFTTTRYKLLEWRVDVNLSFRCVFAIPPNPVKILRSLNRYAPKY